MDVPYVVSRLIIDGCVALPGLVGGADLAGMQAGFERRAAELGRRHLSWEDIQEVPELVAAICPPGMMTIVEAFMAHFGEQAVFANASGVRDTYEPPTSGAFTPFDLAHLKDGPLGWHDDVEGIREPNAPFLQTALSSLIYLDDTFATDGAYCSAIGSHHLAYVGSGNRPVVAPKHLVLKSCELRPVPLQAGGAVLYRAHHWHGVVPMSGRRRIFIHTFCARRTYANQPGHTQLTPATVALLRPAARPYVRHYDKA